MNEPVRSKKINTDLFLIVTTVSLVLIGLVAIYDASVVAAFRDFGDKLYYFKNQLVWASIGSIALLFFSFFDYHKLLKISPLFLGFCTLLLIAVLIPGIGTKVYGARRWINIGTFTFQPSELAKLALIFYETAIIAKFESYKVRLIDALLVLFLPALVVTGLILAEPDLGTALLFIGITLIIYFVGGGSIWHFLLTLPIVVFGAAFSILSSPYRLSRVKSLLDPTHDPQGASYQIYQILVALSSGGLLGVGLGGAHSKFAFIPEVHSDSIFAVIAEELGFVGSLIIISLFIFLIIRAIKIARSAPDSHGKILAVAIVGLISIQSLFNLASIVALVPLTGIPLPFISYGGSSLFVTLVSIGILLNIKSQSV